MEFFIIVLPVIASVVFAWLWNEERKRKNVAIARKEQCEKRMDHMEVEVTKKIQDQNRDVIEKLRYQTMGECVAYKTAIEAKLDGREKHLKRKESKNAEVLDNVKEVLNESLSQVLKNLLSKMTANNFTLSKNRLKKFFDYAEKRGITVGDDSIKEMYEDLESKFRKIVKAAEEREHQQRIKEQIREEQKVLREIENETRRIARERKIVEEALRAAEKASKGEHTAEVEMLEQKIRDLEEQNQRAESRAQQTRSGYVYVISNRGSFGDDVIKIGMTRRLEPMDRVKELGDASVPFPFDVHMMISCDDAPSLENEMHRKFDKARLNKVNRRKEFFRVDLKQVADAVIELHGEIEYEADAEALEYAQSLEMDEDTEHLMNEVTAKD